MKTKLNFIYTTIIAVFLTSCGIQQTYYYQVYKAVPTDKLTNTGNRLVYEDDNCKVSYNLWEQGGNVGFTFYNKTDKDIYLNLEESFFILNGKAHNYYRNRTFSNSINSGTKTSQSATVSKSITGINYQDLQQTNRVQATNGIELTASSGYSISYNEEKIICIPPKASKSIIEYGITESLYRDCDLFLYPYANPRLKATANQIKTKKFSKDESPFVFSNRITYAVGQSSNTVKFENEFYISEISNYPGWMMFEVRYDEFCGQKSIFQTEYFKDASHDKFYIKYIKRDNRQKH